MQIDEVDVPKGKFVLLGGLETGHGFYHCGTFNTLEEAKIKKSEHESIAPRFAAMHARAVGENLDHRTLISPSECLRYLGMSFVIYNDKKQVVT